MVGSRVQHPGRLIEEQAVEVVRNHEDGTRVASAGAPPKRGTARCRAGVDSASENDGGAIFDNPKRGSPAGNRRTARAGQRQERDAKGHEGVPSPVCAA